MNQVFLFDVDGTLTPSRGIINDSFKLWLCNFMDRNECYLVTGSDQAKTIEQIGRYCYNRFYGQFQCSGNQYFKGDDFEAYRSSWTLSDDAKDWLQRALDQSEFPLRTGKHIEERIGLVNFSVVGRNATMGERQLYVKWDKEHKERENIANHFNTIYKPRGIVAQIGGETGIDITQVNKDKSQILENFKGCTIHFFGDACYPGGNDYSIAQKILENGLGYVYNVKDYQETWNILKELS